MSKKVTVQMLSNCQYRKTGPKCPCGWGGEGGGDIHPLVYLYKQAMHSGSSLDINFLFFVFFVSYVSFNLSDDVVKGKKIFSPYNEENWSMEK
jgi:hypothetical protein